MVRWIPYLYCQLVHARLQGIQWSCPCPDGIWTSRYIYGRTLVSASTSALPQWPKLYASINFTQCYTFILPLHWHRWPTANDTSVYISSVVVGLEPPHRLWRPVCQGREVMTPCISPLWTKTGVLQKLPATGLHISPVTHTLWKLIELVRSLSDWFHI